jgi:hypothetical protein
MGLFYLLIGVGLLLVVLWAARWYAAAPPRQVVAGLRWIAFAGGGAAALWLLATGRAAQILYLLIPMAPLLKRWWDRHRATAQTTPGQTSDVETSFLRMSLDHASGSMDGLVLAGGFKGRRLSEMAPAQLLVLLGDLRVSDADSAALLESYLDALHAGWRSADDGEAGAAAGPASPEMTRDEAYRILGLAPGAGREEILKAWRELMKRNHPDHGGSPYLAARINEAKALLLD